jgi:hypothetical protein
MLPQPRSAQYDRAPEKQIPIGRFWSVRVGIHFRAVAVVKGTDMVWFWMGRHDEYESVIEGR